MSTEAASWTRQDRTRAVAAIAPIKAAVIMAYDASPGDTRSWELVSMALKVVERMPEMAQHQDLGAGHVADDAAKLSALLMGARSVPDAKRGPIVHIDAALLVLHDLWPVLGYPEFCHGESRCVTHASRDVTHGHDESGGVTPSHVPTRDTSVTSAPLPGNAEERS